MATWRDLGGGEWSRDLERLDDYTLDARVRYTAGFEVETYMLEVDVDHRTTMTSATLRAECASLGEAQSIADVWLAATVTLLRRPMSAVRAVANTVAK